jgi:hypothetical protein
MRMDALIANLPIPNPLKNPFMRYPPAPHVRYRWVGI